MTLEIVNVSIAQDGKNVVHDASVIVEPGTVTAVLGANGAGKSELVLGVAGVLPVIKGEVRVGDQKLHGMKPDAIRRAGVAAVPEGHRVLTQLTIEENLRVAGSALSRNDLAATLDETYRLFPELAARKAQLAGTLSGGQQQQLSIARALVMKPRLLILDEPTEGIQPSIIKDIHNVITILKDRGEMAILLVEQYFEFARDLCDHYAVMDRGQIILSGRGEDMVEEEVRSHMTV